MSYIANTPCQQAAMLAKIGKKDIAALFESIPASVRLDRPLRFSPALSEMELTSLVGKLAAKNRHPGELACFMGAGAYDHFIPAVVDALASRGEFVTAYTPYQAEASQGSLQVFFEFQTMICQLTGMDVANASLYEAGSGVAEAVMMALSVTNRRGPVLIAGTVHPHYLATLRTFMANLEPEILELPCPAGHLEPSRLQAEITDETPCVVVQHPNFDGALEEVAELARIAKAKGALFVQVFDPVSLGLLKGPGELGADIAVAEGQGLGSPMSYGGPYLGLMACRESLVRKLPGRLVGQTVDRTGKRCWVLALQTREQHIRREKATSNICTNQGLYAIRASIHLAALGPEGLRETARQCMEKAHHLCSQLVSNKVGEVANSRPFFKEFRFRLAEAMPTAAECVDRLVDHGFLAGVPHPHDPRDLLIAVTESRTLEEIEGFAKALLALKGTAGKGG
ncbi:MAG: aminomethyl-transferring glycine dehydrogenase subunit GcvPA [Gemmataceae bacterium]